MEIQTLLGDTPLPLQMKDTLSVIFSHMPLKSLAECARVSKRWKDVTDHFILLEELDLQPKNNFSAFQYASLALNKFQYSKKIKLPKRIYNYKNGEEKTFFTEIYPKGVKNVTALSLPASMDSIAKFGNIRDELAHAILDPLPKSCVRFDYVSFWPEIFNLMTKRHAENMKSLHILLNTGGQISGPWDSLYALIRQAKQLESLGWHYFEHTRFYNGDPNFDVLSDNLAHVLQLATQLQHLNIPPKFNIDTVVKKMYQMPNLTYLYIQEKMTNTLPNTLLEKCSKLQFLHLQLDNSTEQYHITSKTLRTLIISSSVSLNSCTIECPNLEILKFTPQASIIEVLVLGENKIKEFTSRSPIQSIHGSFSLVKIANQNTFMPGNFEQLDSLTSLEELSLECEAPKTQAVYEALEKLSNLTNLRSLELTKVKRFEAVNSELLLKLTKLVLKDCGNDSKELNFINLTNLKDLHVRQCKEITTIEVNGCHQLSKLVFFDNEQLRTVELKGLPNLESVDVRYCALNLSSWRQIEKLPNLGGDLLATVIPMSSYLNITGQCPLITISAKKVLDRVYQGSVELIGKKLTMPFPFGNSDWLSKEEYDESGPNIRLPRKVF